MAVLRTIEGLNPGQLIPVEGESAILGRHPECDIVLDSGAVSRQHARLVRHEGTYFVEDLGSRNGTFVNGRMVSGRQELREGDELAVCDMLFAFHLEPPELEPLAPDVESPTTTAPSAVLLDDDRPSAGSTIMSRVDISSGSSGLRLELNAEAKLKALMEISQSLARAVGLSDVLPNLLESLFKIFLQADRGFVVLRHRETDRLIPMAVKYRRSEDTQIARISRTIVGSVIRSKEAILSADATADDRFEMAESIMDFHIRSMMCAPLVGSSGEALGVIQIDTLDQRHRFNRDDLDVLASVACQAAIAVENAELHEAAVRQQALARELSVAHQVQRGFLPSTSPTIGGYEFFQFYAPAHELGGDYYDYVFLPGERLAVVVGDVSGKGIAASLLMARLSAETRFFLASEPTPGAAVGRLNRVFCDSSWEDRFVTMLVCVLDPARGEITVVNAGHMAPLLRSASGEVEPVAPDESRLPLGVDESTVYPQHTRRLAPGECFALFTDGITEAMNGDGELYGQHRLLKCLGRASAGVSALGPAILNDVKSFVGDLSQSDDMCLVCFGRGGSVTQEKHGGQREVVE